MSNAPREPASKSAAHSSRPRKLRFLALLAIPVLLLLHAPVLAAIVPGALLTLASLDSVEHLELAPPAAELVRADDIIDIERISSATLIHATSRRLG